MSGTSKGWLGSKQRVLCGHCGKESRFDNLPRNTRKVHGQNSKVKFKVIEPKDNALALLKSKEMKQTDNNNTELAKISDKDQSCLVVTMRRMRRIKVLRD